MANTEKRKPLPTIGVDKYTFFAVLTDTSEGATYGDPYNLRGTVEIAVSYTHLTLPTNSRV
mgnify:CR=1 FL=1